jgi:general stress protein 26
MDTTALAFLKTHRVSVLGILQEDNSIHSATLHYSHSEDPLHFYFLTDKASRKCRPLVSGKEVSASLVIGFSEEEFATFQAEGMVSIMSLENDLESGWKAYGSKYPERRGGRKNPDVVLLRFTPIWTRFTDMNNPKKFTAEQM